MGKQRGRGRSRNMNGGLMETDNGRIDCRTCGGRAGDNNREKRGTTITE